MSTSHSLNSKKPLWIAVDTGGTFTDCVWIEKGRLRILKVFSSPKDPSQAIADAVARTGHAGPVVLLHGTTVGTNTLLQRKGARVAFVTTEGFEDTVEIGRQARPKLYDLTFERQAPLVERSLRFGAPERVSSTGESLKKPSREDLRVLARDVHTANPEAIAVSTLFSFANPENERAIGRVLEELGLPISLSHLIIPEFREFERASTVVINAYLQPVMQTYLQSLEARMTKRGTAPSKTRVFVMQSSGGITSLASASRQPVHRPLGASRRRRRRRGHGQAEWIRPSHHFRHGRHIDGRSPRPRRAPSRQRGRGCRTSGAGAHARHSHRRRGWRVNRALRRRWRAARGT
jgi:N-methylhydantoinase A